MIHLHLSHQLHQREILINNKTTKNNSKMSSMNKLIINKKMNKTIIYNKIY